MPRLAALPTCPSARAASRRLARWMASAVVAVGLVAVPRPAVAASHLLEPAATAEDHALRQAVTEAVETGRLRLRMPDGARLDVAVEPRFRDGFLHLRGRGPLHAVHLVVAGRSLHGSIQSGGVDYQIGRHGGRARLERALPPALPLTDDARVPPDVPGTAPASAARPPATGATGRQPIDVLAFLDPRVSSELGANGARASWLLNVEVTNEVMANSQVADARLRTVGFVDYPVSATRLSDKLDDFQPDPFAIERRDAFGADFASLYTPALDGDTICGIAYLFGLRLNPDGSFTPFSNNDDFSAFSVSGTTEALAGAFGCGLLTVPHEFGHNLAANHNLGNGGGSPFPYSVGDRCGTLDTSDIMSNRALRISDARATRIYSTPRVSVDGQPCGVVDTVDNARAVDQTYDFSAAYRNPPPTLGSLSLTPLVSDVSEAADELLVTLTRSGELGVIASVEVAAIGDARSARSALEGLDFVETVRRVSFPVGVASVDVRVPLIETAGDQGRRDLLVVPRYPIGLTVPDGLFAAVAIIDSTLSTTLAIENPAISVSETQGSATFRLTRTGSTLGAVSVGFTVGGGTATAGADYVAASGTVNWADGDGSTKSVVVTVLDDSVFEASPAGETVNLVLSNPQGGAVLGAPSTGVLTILDNEVAQPGALSFSTATYGVSEGGTATIRVTRTGGTDGAVSVRYASGGGTATAGADYMAVSGTLSWANGDGGAKTFTVAIIDDATDEPAETVGLQLSTLTGGATLGNPAAATLTITDNDNDDAPPPPPLPPPPPAAPSAGGGGAVGLLMLVGGWLLSRRRRRR